MADGATADMTGGIYRRIYAGFITGRRINALSWKAEAWFWRLHALADDFGNLPSSPEILRCYAAPLRSMTKNDAKAMTSELVKQRLVIPYESAGDSYLHIDGFESRQPARANGKRIQKYPIHPGNIGTLRGILNNPGVSGCVQVSPENPAPPIPIPMPTHTKGAECVCLDDGGNVITPEAWTDHVVKVLGPVGHRNGVLGLARRIAGLRLEPIAARQLADELYHRATEIVTDTTLRKPAVIWLKEARERLAGINHHA